MSLHLYAITASALDLSGTNLTGIGGASLQWLEASGLRALVSKAAADQSVRAALEHHAVVAGAHDRIPTLPARYAAPLEAGVLATHLRDHAERHLERLARIGAALEFGVRIASTENPPSTATPHTSSGAAFLRARGEALRLEATRREQLEGVASTLEAFVRREALEVCGAFSAELYRASVLVSRNRLDSFEALAFSFSPPDGVQLSWHGPFPPYSFVQTPSSSHSAAIPAGGPS